MPAAEWRVARLATRRRTAVTRAQVETVSGRALGLFGLVFGAQTLPLALDQSRRSIRGRRRRADGRAVRRDGGARRRDHHEGRRPRRGARVRRALRASRCSRGRSSSSTRPRSTASALALLHLHGRDDHGRRRPAGSDRDGVHDRRAGHLRRHPAAARGRRGRPLLAVLDAMYAVDPRRRRAHHRHDAAAGGRGGRHRAGGRAGALRRRRTPARHRDTSGSRSTRSCTTAC